MLRTMLTATNTLNQIQLQIDTISNNIANIGTNGYKAKEARFSEMLYQEYHNTRKDEQSPRLTPQGIRYGVGAKISQIQTNNAQGTLQTTDRPLDFAFNNARQYFNILMPDENGDMNVVYTRKGDFYATPMNNGQMMLVNADGYAVADIDGNPIVFDEEVSSFSLENGGRLVVNLEDGTQQAFLLGVTEIHLPQLMMKISDEYIDVPDNLNELGYELNDVLTDMQGNARQNIGLENYQLELSNVNMAIEMTQLIQAQKSYQFNARAITIADQMLGLINGIR
ncbi:flagellar hook-basal body protein [Ureibacillus sp. FSL W7-1570]|uniref:flagellar hook-basal body protein n=1 Tax=Ureibacillus sp. FSL W7-1570 TaxID=2954593 RepID=UPI00315A3132